MRNYLSYTNRRGKEYGASAADGSWAHLRGWNAGVKVEVSSKPGLPDEILVYMTTGSTKTAPNVLLGTVRETKGGPVFVPAIDSSLDDDIPIPFA